MNVLFIVPYPTEGPSNRYRVEQYLPYLKGKGIDYSLQPFISSDFFKILYKRGNLTKKCLYFFLASLRRCLDVIKGNEYDVVFVHIESFPFGPAILEWFFSKLNKPIIYDFEDAIYLPNFTTNNKFINYLKCPHKFYQILGLSSHIIVCNKYMRDLVYPYNNNVTVIPTSIDTEKFKLKDFSFHNKKPIVGWIGSHTTSYCLEPLTKVFISLAKKYDFYLKIIGAGKDFRIPGVNIINKEWTLEEEVDDFQKLDIGIYPLPDDERSKAKTPFKTIQYMSVGVPAVVSRVGGNIDIVQDGVNGFLASKEEEWFEKLSRLFENPELRVKIGNAGRKTVEERFSLNHNAPLFHRVITQLV
ncbi:MAG: glycosyltransferase family 4 protein [Thermodesulfobacteriota bacterium]